MGGLDLVLEFGALWLHPIKLKIASPSPNQRLITKAANDPFIWLATDPPEGPLRLFHRPVVQLNRLTRSLPEKGAMSPSLNVRICYMVAPPALSSTCLDSCSLVTSSALVGYSDFYLCSFDSSSPVPLC